MLLHHAVSSSRHSSNTAWVIYVFSWDASQLADAWGLSFDFRIKEDVQPYRWSKASIFRQYKYSRQKHLLINCKLPRFHIFPLSGTSIFGHLSIKRLWLLASADVAGKTLINRPIRRFYVFRLYGGASVCMCQ